MYEFLTTRRIDRLFLVRNYQELRRKTKKRGVLPDTKKVEFKLAKHYFHNENYTPLIHIFNDIIPKKALELHEYIYEYKAFLSGHFNGYDNEYCGVFFNYDNGLTINAILCVDNKYIRQFKYACYVGNINLAMQYCVILTRFSTRTINNAFLASVEHIQDNASFYPSINKLKTEKQFNSVKELYNYSLVEIPNIIKEHING